MNHCELEEVTQHINNKISTIKRLLELELLKIETDTGLEQLEAKDPDKRGTLLKIEHDVTAISELLDRFERYVGQQRDLLKHLKDLEAFSRRMSRMPITSRTTPSHAQKRATSNSSRWRTGGSSERADRCAPAPQEQGPPRKPQRKQIKEMEFITVSEFDGIPPYMKGRVTYGQLNAVVQSINAAVTAKYKILHQSIKTLNNASRMLHQRFKDQETKDTKGQFFIVEQDIREFTQLKVDKRFVGMLNMLRHCQRLKEVRGGGLTRFILL